VKKVVSILLFALVAVFIATTTTVNTNGARDGGVSVLSPTVLNASADTLIWMLQGVKGTTLLGHFYATGDDATVILNVKGSNYSPSDERWVDLGSYSFSGTSADTTYFSPASTATYATYRFQLTANDTTTVDGRVKIN
jgi:hypothetical protein